MEKTYPLNLPCEFKGNILEPGTLLDAEKFIRLNPIWIIQELQENGGRFQANLKNHDTEVEFTLSGTIDTADPGSFKVSFSEGEVGAIVIVPDGDTFSATVNYLNPDFQEESTEERDIVMWLRSIQEYLRLHSKKSLNSLLFRFIMNRVVLKMTPSQRKISLMLLRITAIELLVIVLIVAGYVFFVLRS